MCEIGEQVGYVGQVKQVKILGVMALLDEGETDWKVIVVDVRDPLAGRLNDIEDVERHLPGLVRATNEWFRYVTVFPTFREPLLTMHRMNSIYKIRKSAKSPDPFTISSKILIDLMSINILSTCIADGKPENAFAFSGEAKNKKYATEIVHECHEAWKRLASGQSPAKTASYDLSM